MPDWNTEKGIAITDATPTGDAGVKLNDNFERLRDETPFNTASDPTVNDDSADGFFAGSQWFNTSTEVMWVCTDATAGAAVWRSLYKRESGALILCPSDGSGQRALQLDSSGNARGNNAVDLQTQRFAVTQVASGDRAFIAGGEDNTASGSGSHAEGNEAEASGSFSHAEGSKTTASGNRSHAEGNQTNAIGAESHAEGLFSQASGAQSHAEGSGCTASGARSHAEGKDTTASENDSHAEGLDSLASGFSAHAEGRDTTASGDQAHAEGWYTEATSDFSHTGGHESKAHLLGQWARSSGGHSGELGTAQSTITHLFRRTTTASATELTLNGGSASATSRYSVLDGQTLSCLVNIVGRKENGGANDHASFLRQVCIRREGTTTQLVGTVQTVGTDINPAGWGGVTITADDTNESLKIDVAGAASTNIRWTATVIASEAADAAL